MAVKWKDMFITTSGATGTYADPYGWNENGSFADGDECRIKAKTISSILESGTDTVHITNTNRCQLTVQGTQNLTYSAFDILYFPDYGTFWKINSSVSGGVLNGTTNNYVCVPIRNNTNITVQKVDMSIFAGSSNTSTTIYFGAGHQNYYIPTTDAWTSETSQTTDGTAITILSPQGTSTSQNFYCNTGGTTGTMNTGGSLYPTGSTENYTEVNCPHSVILPANSTSNSNGWNFYATRVKTLKLKQLYIGRDLYYTPIICSVFDNITVDITHLSLYNPLAFFRTTFQNDNDSQQNSLTPYSRKTLTANFDYVYSHTNGPISGERAYYPQGKGNNLDITIGEQWSINRPEKLFSICEFHDVTIDIGPIMYTGTQGGFSEFYVAWDITGTVSITYTNFKLEDGNLNNNTNVTWHGTLEEGASYYRSKPSGAKFASISQFPLPSGFTVTNSSIRPYAYNYGASSRFTNTFTQNMKEFSQPYVVDIPQSAPSTLNSDFRFPTNSDAHGTIYKFSDNVIYVTPQAGSASSSYNRQVRYWPYLTLDNSVVRTTGNSLKWKLDSYSTSYIIRGPATQDVRTHSIYPLYIPVLSGTSYTFTGYLRTDRTGMATGDAWLDAYNSDGAYISRTNFTSSALNAWEAVSVTFSAAEDGFARFAFKACWNGNSQNYWIDDVEVS